MITSRLKKRLRRPQQFVAEVLETRFAPSATLLNSFPGLSNTDNGSSVTPPDTILAVGPTAVIEGINTEIGFYDKNTGALLAPAQSLENFFGPVFSQGNQFSDPYVVYDDTASRFYFVAIEITANHQFAYLDVAVSNTSNPLDGFTEMHKISTVTEGNTEFADYPKMGWNADAVVVTFNQFNVVTKGFDHCLVLTMDKSTLLDANSSTLTNFQTVQNTDEDFNLLMPARMHGSSPGGAMYFVQTPNPTSEDLLTNIATFDSVNVVKMTNVLTANPTFTTSSIPVNSYEQSVLNPFLQGNEGEEEGGRMQIANVTSAIDNRMFSADYRGGQLVASNNSILASDGLVHALWYQFDTTGASPVLFQQGSIAPFLNNADTYYPSVAIDPIGNIGMTFLESSSTEFVSMYVTGHAAGEASGFMGPAIPIATGLTALYGNRAGDYSGTDYDVATNSFWSANEFATRDAVFGNWATAIAQFNVGLLSNVDLQTASDSGRSSTDNVTNISLGTLDITTFAASGATVQVFRSGSLLGSAAFVSSSVDGNLYRYTFAPAQLQEGVNSISARATVGPNVGLFSPVLAITLDTVKPTAPTSPDLVSASDTGPVNYDNITGDKTPSFTGTSEVGSMVRLFSTGSLVGLVGLETLGSAQSTYLVTTGALPLGGFSITATAEDLAGNISSPASAALVLTEEVSVLPSGADPILIIPDLLGSWPAAGNFGNWLAKNSTGINPANLQMNPLDSSYGNLINTLTSLGYTPEVGASQTLFFGSYDWRAPLGLVDKKVFGVSDGLPDITASDITNGDLNSGVEYFAYWMNQIQTLGFSHVNVVTFGMGGLLARSFIEEGFYNPLTLKIDNLAMVGTPNHGSSDAFYAINRSNLLPDNDHWNVALDLASVGGQGITKFAPSVFDLQPQYTVLGTVTPNSFLANLNSKAGLNALSAAITNNDLHVTNYLGSGILTPQDAGKIARITSTDGDGVVLNKLSGNLKVQGVANVVLKSSQQLIDVGALGLDHNNLPTDLQQQVFGVLGLPATANGYQQQQQDLLAVVDNVVFKAIQQSQIGIVSGSATLVEQAINFVYQDASANHTTNYVSAWVQPTLPLATDVQITDPNGNVIAVNSGVETSAIPGAAQFGNGFGRFMIAPNPVTGTYGLNVSTSALAYSASLVTADATGEYGIGGPIATNNSFISLTLPGQVTLAKLSSNQPLAYLDGDGDWVTVLLSGPGYADVQLATTASNGDLLKQIVLHGATSATNLSVSVQRRGGGDGQTEVGLIEALVENAAAQNMGTITLAGSLNGLVVSGSIKSLAATSIAPNGSVNIGATSGATAASQISLNTIGEGASLNFNGKDLGQWVVTHGTGGGLLSAGSINSIQVPEGSFGLNLSLTGDVKSFTVTGGDVSGKITSAGDLNLTLKSVQDKLAGSLGGTLSGVVFAADIGNLTAQNLNSAILSIAGALSNLRVDGNMAGSTLSTHSPFGMGTLNIGGNLTQSNILSGANLGADGILGGVGSNADSFGAGAIGNIHVGGDVVASRVGAGLSSGVNGVFNSAPNHKTPPGDDHAASAIKSFFIGGTASVDSYFAASAFGNGTVVIDGVSVAPASDLRFLVG